jgi:polysaccharide biosynthesis transport protein
MSKNFELLSRLGTESHVLEQNTDRFLPNAKLATGARESRESAGVPLREPSGEWQRARHILLRHWRLSALFAGAVVVAVVLVTLLTKPVYEATASLEVDPPGAEVFSLESRSPGGSDVEYIGTQARNLESDALAIAVIRQMHLDQNPEFTRRGLFTRMLGVFASSKKRNSQPETKLLTLTPEESAALAYFQSQLSITRDSTSRLLSVSFASHDPELAAEVTNTLAATFIDRMYQTRHAAIMQSTEWLSKQLDDIRAKTDESNRALVDFQRTSGIADLERDRSTVSEEMTELSRQKTLASADRMQFESFLQKAKRDNIDTLPQVQTSPVVQQLSQKLAEARAELSQASAVYGTSHPTVKKLQNGVDELEAQLRLQRNLIVSQMEMSYSAALGRERLVDAEMKGATKKLGLVAEYNNLKKQSQTNTELYDALYGRVKEAGIAAASKSSNIRVVEEARVLDSPTRPKPLKNFGFGLLAAIVGGLMLAFGYEAIDTRIHDIEDIRQYTGISAVAVLPISGAQGNGVRRLGSLRDRPARFLAEDPQSEQSEAMRSMHTTLVLSNPNRPPQMVLVTSSLPGEGKSTVAINLATMLARQGRTCLLDADLRRPAVAQAFNLVSDVGVREHLTGAVPVESILFAVEEVRNLAIIPAGSAVHDSEVPFERMRELLRALRARFDFVVVDSPPILAYADGRALAPFVDGIVFVSRANMVTREALTRSLELLDEVHSAPVIEIVLNGASAKSQTYGYSSYRSYHRA